MRTELAEELIKRKAAATTPPSRPPPKPVARSDTAIPSATKTETKAEETDDRPEKLKSKRHRSRSQKDNHKAVRAFSTEDPTESLNMLRSMVLDLDSDEEKPRPKKRTREMSRVGADKSSPQTRSRTPSAGCEEKDNNNSGSRKKKISSSDKKSKKSSKNGSVSSSGGSRRKLRRTKTSPSDDPDKPSGASGTGDDQAAASGGNTPKRGTSKSKSPRGGKSSGKSLVPGSGKKITRSLSSNVTDSNNHTRKTNRSDSDRTTDSGRADASRTDSNGKFSHTGKKSHSNSRLLSSPKITTRDATPRSPASRKSSQDYTNDSNENEVIATTTTTTRRIGGSGSIGRTHTKINSNVGSLNIQDSDNDELLTPRRRDARRAKEDGETSATATTTSTGNTEFSETNKLALNLKKTTGNTPRIGSVPTPNSRKKDSSHSSGRNARSMTPRSLSEDKNIPRNNKKITKDEGRARDPSKSPGRNTRKIRSPSSDSQSSKIIDSTVNPLDTNFKIDKELGRGMYGVVWKATNVLTGAVVAVKQVDTTLADATTLPKIMRAL